MYPNPLFLAVFWKHEVGSFRSREMKAYFSFSLDESWNIVHEPFISNQSKAEE